MDDALLRLEARVRELEEAHAMLLAFVLQLVSMVEGQTGESLEAQHREFLLRCRERDANDPGRRRRGFAR